VREDAVMVRPGDLMRKSLDELALALHWHVLFTMVHSAWRKFELRSKGVMNAPVVTFRIKKMHVVDSMIANRDFIEIRVLLSGGGMFIDGVEEYQAADSLDARMLLNHVVTVTSGNEQMAFVDADGNPAGKYYFEDALSVVHRLRGFANFISHKNATVRRSFSRDFCRETHQEISRREKAAINEYFKTLWVFCDKLKTHQEDLIKHHTDHDAKVQDDQLYSTRNGWIAAFARDLLRTSTIHLDACKRIIRMSQNLEKAIEGASLNGDDATLQLQNLLQSLEDENEELPKVQSDSDSRDTRFALFTLWTRFGSLPPEADDENVSDVGSIEKLVHQESEIARKHNSLKFGTIKARRFKIERSGMKFNIVTAEECLVDPLCITHLDLINEMLDVTIMVLREILIVCACKFEVEREISMRNFLVETLLLLQSGEKRLEIDHELSRNLPADVAIFHEPFRRGPSDMKSMELFRLFSRRKDVQDSNLEEEELVKAFVCSEPRFADPRFLFELLNRLHHPITGNKLLRMAQIAVKTRDKAVHHFHLVDDYSFEDLYSTHGNLRSFLEEVGSISGVDLHRIDEFEAFDEVLAMIGYYKGWTARQQLAFHKFDKQERMNKAMDAVRSLLKREHDLNEQERKSLHFLMGLWTHFW